MKDTLKFFEIAKPLPLTSDDAQVQLGVHLEEITEMFEDGLGFSYQSPVVENLKVLADHYKKNADMHFITDMNKVALLDSLADQYVTLIGTARALGFDIEGAVAEVEASNLSKFIFVGDADITPYQLGEFAEYCNSIEAEGRYKGVHWVRIGEYVVFFDENGKIMKSPKTYFEPDLSKFI